MANFTKPYFERISALVKYLPFGVVFDLFCYTREEFKDMFELRKIHIMDAVQNGVVLHESSFYRDFRKQSEN